MAVIAVLAALGIPRYAEYRERIRVEQAVADVLAMSAQIMNYAIDNHAQPDSLAEVRSGQQAGPLGQTLCVHQPDHGHGHGSARKDKNTNPLNSDFDLYSVGKDGDSKLPLSPKVSWDDVIRARDGRFVGLGKDFDP